MHLMYGIAEVNALRAIRLNRNSFPESEMPGHRFFTNLYWILRGTGSFRVNRVKSCRSSQRIVESEQWVMTILKTIPVLDNNELQLYI